MPKRPATDPLDIQARAAFGTVALEYGGADAIAGRCEFSRRTAERLYSRQLAVPPGIADEIAGFVEADPHASYPTRVAAQRLRAWALACRQQDRSHAAR